MPVRYGFRRPGDGDDFEEWEPEDLLDLVLDELLETGDLDEVLNRLAYDGVTTPDGDRLDGIRDLLEQARQKRRELEELNDPGGMLADIQERLDAIEAMERADLQALKSEADESGDERRIEVTTELVDEKQMALDLLPDAVGDRIGSLRNYDFVSSEAREEFEKLVGELRDDVVNSYFEANKEFFANPDPEELARMRSMMDALSTMLEQQRRGEEIDPSFDEFMSEYGDYFPGAESLEDVVRMMAERAAAAEAMFNSLSADQQAELRGLFQSMLDDLDLSFSLNRLIGNLREATPDIDWQRANRYRGTQPSRFSSTVDATRDINRLKDLERFLEGSVPASRLNEIDIDTVRRNLGADVAKNVERLQKALKGLTDKGLIDRSGGRTTLSAKGMRRIAGSALKELFSQLRSSSLGAHRHASTNRGHDREETSKPWEPGEAFNLHLGKTLRNAVFRQGPGTPIRLTPEDFEVEEHEAMVRSATVIAVDLSLSMEMRGNLAPAKKMVLALAHLIRTAYPRDYVAIVGFGLTAHEIKFEDVPFLTIDFDYGTNLQHALALSRHLMRAEKGSKQVIVVTDGEPTAHLLDNGQPFFNWPPVYETLHTTMAEVLRSTRAGITINTFALDIERSQFPFVEQIAKVNGGRTFYTDVDNLGRYVLDDFVRAKSFRP